MDTVCEVLLSVEAVSQVAVSGGVTIASSSLLSSSGASFKISLSAVSSESVPSPASTVAAGAAVLFCVLLGVLLTEPVLLAGAAAPEPVPAMFVEGAAEDSASLAGADMAFCGAVCGNIPGIVSFCPSFSALSELLRGNIPKISPRLSLDSAPENFFVHSAHPSKNSPEIPGKYFRNFTRKFF